MALGVYVGAGSSVKTVSDIYVGVNNTPRKVKEIYVGVNGTPRKCWPPYTDYGDTVNLFSYGNGVALYKSNAPAADSDNPENVANGTASIDPCIQDSQYQIAYISSGTCIYVTTKDKYDLRGYNYATVIFGYSTLLNHMNASHRISIGTNIKVGPHTDSLRNTTGVDDMDNVGEQMNILIDLRSITAATEYYIKAGVYLSSSSGYFHMKCSSFKLHKTRPVFSYDYMLAPV